MEKSVLMRVVFPRPDSPERANCQQEFAITLTYELTNNHDGEVCTTFGDNFVSLNEKKLISRLIICSVLSVCTWLGRLAMPIPSAETFAVAIGGERRKWRSGLCKYVRFDGNQVISLSLSLLGIVATRRYALSSDEKSDKYMLSIIYVSQIYSAFLTSQSKCSLWVANVIMFGSRKNTNSWKHINFV